MKTPEWVAAEVSRAYDLSCYKEATDLIRARDAEVAEAARAEALAGFTEQTRTVFGWMENGCNPDAHRRERRLVGPWEPVEP